jgi:hypothetical protein
MSAAAMKRPRSAKTTSVVCAGTGAVPAGRGAGLNGDQGASDVALQMVAASCKTVARFSTRIDRQAEPTDGQRADARPPGQILSPPKSAEMLSTAIMDEPSRSAPSIRFSFSSELVDQGRPPRSCHSRQLRSRRLVRLPRSRRWGRDGAQRSDRECTAADGRSPKGQRIPMPHLE